MNASVFVDDARQRADEMIRARSRGPGDLDNAMHGVARELGVSYGEIWRLRYRPGKEIPAHIYAAIVRGHEQLCARQREAYLAERDGFAPQVLLARAFLRAADALAGEND